MKKYSIKSITYVISTVLAAVAAGVTHSAAAQSFPARTVRVIIPFSAGGAADVPGRILAQRLSDVFKQAVVVENRPGAGSTIGAEAAAKSPPDGHTLFLISNTHFVSAALHKKLPYDALNDYTPISQITSAANILLVHPSLPVKTVKDLIALAKAAPSSRLRLLGQRQHAALDRRVVHQNGGRANDARAVSRQWPGHGGLLAGQVTVGFPGIAGMLPFIKSGKLRPLGISSAKRSSELPDVPTIAEAGVPGYEIVSWFGIAAPKGLTREVQMRIHGDLLRVLNNPDFQKSMRAMGQELSFQDTPEKFFDFMKVEAAKWARVVADSGARVE